VKDLEVSESCQLQLKDIALMAGISSDLPVIRKATIDKETYEKSWVGRLFN
jgi:hypothetical protein